MNTIENIVKWFVVSSADPDRVALSLRASLLMGVPYILNIVTAACGIGLVCLGIGETELRASIEAVISTITGGLYIVGGVLFLYGLGRKFYKTFTGEHTVE